MNQMTPYIPPPCEKPVSFVHVDGHFLVVVKPEGLLSVPGLIVKDCVSHRLASAYPDVRIVHRLDLDTSGLMVVSLSQRATSDLNRQFRERLVTKRYVAVVYGEPATDKGEIELPISPDPHHRPFQRIDPVGGKRALTRYEVLSREGDRSRVSLTPETGRSHQLRIHLAAVGHPILGCDLYAHPEAFSMAGRLMLHAGELGFGDPVSGEPLWFASGPEF